jgi:hypothetical protein
VNAREEVTEECIDSVNRRVLGRIGLLTFENRAECRLVITPVVIVIFHAEQRRMLLAELFLELQKEFGCLDSIVAAECDQGPDAAQDERDDGSALRGSRGHVGCEYLPHISATDTPHTGSLTFAVEMIRSAGWPDRQCQSRSR